MRYEVTTSLTPEEVIEDALNYFGPGSTGLEVTSQTSQGVVFQGAVAMLPFKSSRGLPPWSISKRGSGITRYVNLWRVSADAVGGQTGGGAGQNRPRQKREHLHLSMKSHSLRFWTIKGQIITVIRGSSET